MRAHAFLHVSFEDLGTIEALLLEKGYAITYTRFYEEDAILPNVEEVDFLIVMGGSMSVNDEAIFPWLSLEKEWIRRMIKTGKPVLGICLGAQLIASALGSRVYRNKDTEIGWFPILSTGGSLGEDVFHFPKRLEVFHWHGETFELPQNAIWLAKSEACAHQVFQIGRHVIGMQCHLEMTYHSIQTIVKNCHDELVEGDFIQSEAAMMLRIEERTHKTKAVMRSLLDFLHVKHETLL